MKWDTDKAKQLTRQARVILSDHGPHSDQIARDNCGACAVNKYTDTDAPNYAGWLRVYIEAGKPIPRQHYQTEMAYAERENIAYRDAILRDIETYGITYADGGK